MTSTQSTGSGADAEALAEQRQDLSYIRSELVRYRADTMDDGLRAALTEWLIAARELPAASTREHVASELAAVRDGNEMFRQPSMTDGTDAFPDRCSDCEHYGDVCPVLARNGQIDRRKHILEEHDDPQRLRQALREYAIDNGCVVLKRALDDVEQEYEPLLRRGQILLFLVEEQLLFRDDGETVMRAAARRKMLPEDVDPDDLLSRLNGHPDDPLLAPTAEIGAATDAGDDRGNQDLTADAESELQEAVATDGGDD
jgi:ferredoxin